ncbi:hypothetical protein M885DRAFT_619776, partial [Pelagophyceae sp. CCMP2097]
MRVVRHACASHRPVERRHGRPEGAGRARRANDRRGGRAHQGGPQPRVAKLLADSVGS